jgi:hypothetical protein
MAKDAKTKAGPADVDAFIAASAKPADGAALCSLMAKVSGEAPTMWGASIVGFGRRTYDLAGGKTGEICAMGFSPRKGALVLYVKHAKGWEERLARLGKHSTGTSCLYINKLADVDAGVLEELVQAAWDARDDRRMY